jgi:hypothetical protein
VGKIVGQLDAEKKKYPNNVKVIGLYLSFDHEPSDLETLETFEWNFTC